MATIVEFTICTNISQLDLDIRERIRITDAIECGHVYVDASFLYYLDATPFSSMSGVIGDSLVARRSSADSGDCFDIADHFDVDLSQQFLPYTIERCALSLTVHTNYGHLSLRHDINIFLKDECMHVHVTTQSCDEGMSDHECSEIGVTNFCFHSDDDTTFRLERLASNNAEFFQVLNDSSESDDDRSWIANSSDGDTSTECPSDDSHESNGNDSDWCSFSECDDDTPHPKRQCCMDE